MWFDAQLEIKILDRIYRPPHIILEYIYTQCSTQNCRVLSQSLLKSQKSDKIYMCT